MQNKQKTHWTTYAIGGICVYFLLIWIHSIGTFKSPAVRELNQLTGEIKELNSSR